MQTTMQKVKPTVLILCTGNSCRSHLAEGILRAVALPAGSHHVEVRYAPRSLALGGWISAVALAGSALALVIGWRFSRQR